VDIEHSEPSKGDAEPQKISSAVEVVESRQITKFEGDEQIRSRNQRMFGVLRGTLLRFQEDTTTKEPKEKKRQELERQTDEKIKEEREVLKEERFQEKMRRIEEAKKICRRPTKKTRGSSVRISETRMDKTSNATHGIFIHSRKTKNLLSTSETHIDDKISSFPSKRGSFEEVNRESTRRKRKFYWKLGKRTQF